MRGIYFVLFQSDGSQGRPADSVGDAIFDWLRTEPQGSCLAGYYEGAFDGVYNFQAMTQLTWGWAPSLDVI